MPIRRIHPAREEQLSRIQFRGHPVRLIPDTSPGPGRTIRRHMPGTPLNARSVENAASNTGSAFSTSPAWPALIWPASSMPAPSVTKCRVVPRHRAYGRAYDPAARVLAVFPAPGAALRARTLEPSRHHNDHSIRALASTSRCRAVNMRSRRPRRDQRRYQQ
jgi:hypothetical protein